MKLLKTILLIGLVPVLVSANAPSCEGDGNHLYTAVTHPNGFEFDAPISDFDIQILSDDDKRVHLRDNGCRYGYDTFKGVDSFTFVATTTATTTVGTTTETIVSTTTKQYSFDDLKDIVVVNLREVLVFLNERLKILLQIKELEDQVLAEERAEIENTFNETANNPQNQGLSFLRNQFNIGGFSRTPTNNSLSVTDPTFVQNALQGVNTNNAGNSGLNINQQTNNQIIAAPTTTVVPSQNIVTPAQPIVPTNNLFIPQSVTSQQSTVFIDTSRMPFGSVGSVELVSGNTQAYIGLATPGMTRISFVTPPVLSGKNDIVLRIRNVSTNQIYYQAEVEIQ